MILAPRMSKEKFGRWLQKHRRKRKWTLRAVEQALLDDHSIRLSDTHLCQLEHGKRELHTVSAYVIRALVLVYDLDAGETLAWFGLGSGMAIGLDDQKARKKRSR